MITLFLVLILLDVALITWFTEGFEPHPIASVVVIGGSLAFYHFFIAGIDYHNILTYTRANSGAIIGSVVGWVILGVLWSFFKWYVFLKDNKEYQDTYYAKHREFREETYKGKEIPPRVYDIPQAVNNKERIITWMMYWPFSIIGFLLSNPLQRFFKWIYNQISGVYERITKSVYS